VPVIDAVSLTRQLIAFDTVNPPGNEAVCTSHLGELLASAGFEVTCYEMAPGRPCLVARHGAQGDGQSLCFVGHTDTVPLGTAPWTHGPFAGEIVDGRLYGRGASDMKSGVAAFVAAAIQSAPTLPPGAGITLLLVPGEETGCEGSSHLASLGLHFNRFRGVVVAEPTANMPLVGHKGALWLRATVKGVAAHGAMPTSGINAVRKGAELVHRLDGFCRHCRPHPVLGEATLNVGTFRGGQNVNSVPDWAEIGIDIRTVPGVDHADMQQRLAALLAPELDVLSVDISMPHVWTPPEDEWVRSVFAVVERETGEQVQVDVAPYFTDASALQGMLDGAPTLILGPGAPHMMHQTDEYCEVARIEQAVRIYRALMQGGADTPIAAVADVADAATQI
jgi:succinyl-diaminopimelate desuccinylase